MLLPTLSWDGGIVRAFRRDSDAAAADAERQGCVASRDDPVFNYEEGRGHPSWLPPSRWRRIARDGTLPASARRQPAGDPIHGQLDFGATSLASKVKGREPVRIHPQDAAARGITVGDIVRLSNDRGLASPAQCGETLRPGVVQLSTGAWYDPEEPSAEKSVCVHSNPNVLTRDAGTSRLAQGCTGQLCSVEKESYRVLPPVRTFDPPPNST